MKHIEIRSVAGVLFLLTVVVCPQCSRAQDSADEPLPGLRQPGDDVAKELPKSETPTEEAKARSLAAYMEGLAAQKEGKFDEAVKAFEKAAEADPTAPEPVRAHALLLVRLNRLKAAEELARRAAELDPDDYEIRLQLADLLLARRSVDDALGLVEEALGSKRLKKDSKDFIAVHRVRGTLYLLTRNAPKAAESYGVLLYALERPEDFGLDFREHQRLMNDRATGYESIGRIMLEIGRYDAAVNAFSALSRVNGDRPGDYNYWLALTQYRKDDLQAAEKNLNSYFETGKRSRESLRLLTDVLNADGRGSEAADRLKQLAENTADAATVRLFLGEVYVEKGDAEAAREIFRSVIADSGDADAWLGLIKVDILTRNAESLLTSLNKAIRARIRREELVPLEDLITQDPTFGKQFVEQGLKAVDDKSQEMTPVAARFTATIAEKLELFPEEEKLLLATLEANPGMLVGVEALNRLGLNQFNQEKYAESAASFRKLLSVPSLPQDQQIMALYRLSYAETLSENHDAALVAIETALSLRADNPELTFQLGWVQLQAKKLDAAEGSLKKAAELGQGDAAFESRARLLLAALYTQQHRWEDGIATYEAVLKIADNTPENIRRARMGLSNAWVQKGDMAQGEKIMEEVYRESPDDPGVN
ncbi:MAG: tetratricopeptide repeat protein, partial [Planctomycetaceae bacterium]|nr:tetratricopeptide repeat protein [Planctomycetaceae bacterium]